MKHLLPLGQIDTTQALLQIKQNPQLWDQHRERTWFPESPHYGVNDIWVRGRDWKHLNQDWREFYDAPYDSVWHPPAAVLPAVKEICFQLMALTRGEKLGVVLVTRIPPGGQVKPHNDAGSYNSDCFEKYCVQLASHPEQAFCYEDGSYSAMPGEVYWFRNTVPHWVVNPTPVERISLIVSIMSERGESCRDM